MRRILLNRYAEPEDVSPAFVFFASDDSRYITGQLLPCRWWLRNDVVDEEVVVG